MSEDSLKTMARTRLKYDFHILEEVLGRHSIYEKEVRIDLLLKPKERLVAAGFVDEWFGVECKWVEGIHGQTAKATKAIWQSITYAQSVFTVENKPVKPCFVALLTPDLAPPIATHISTLFQLALYGNVAKMYFYRDGSWGIKFAYIYARSDNGSYQINERQLPKYRAGSIA
jgi:hypothetical protein